MKTPIEAQKPAQNPLANFVRLAFHVWLRLLAIIFFALTVEMWMSAVGYWEGVGQRFDTMSAGLKIYTAVLSVLLPVASVGLWTTLSWGRVVWFLAIGFQILAKLRLGDEIEVMPWVILFHILSILVYLAFQLALNFIEKER